MQINEIRREAQRLKAKYHTDDPYEICREMRIRVMEMPMGTGIDSCKGFFTVQNRCMIIVLNEDLPVHIRRIILAHELAHASLHGNSAISAFHDFSLLDNSNMMEYEANVFASEFLLTNDDVLEAMEQQLDFFGTASLLCVPPELLSFKVQIMKKDGYAINSPFAACGDFLKRDISKPMC